MTDDEPQKLSEIESALLGLVRGEHSSIHLTYNDHASSYVDRVAASSLQALLLHVLGKEWN